jgi:hypothetical protein
MHAYINTHEENYLGEMVIVYEFITYETGKPDDFAGIG